MAIPKFPQVSPSIYQVMRERVNQYFADKHVDETGNAKLYSKAIILVTTLIATYTHLVFFTPVNNFIALFECAFMGFVVALIGFNVMHDGAHGSFSKKEWLNELAAFSLNVLGGSAAMWKMKHNQIHHTYTNIDGYDEDIEAGPFLKLSPHQKTRSFHKFQHIYFWFLYALLYALWIFYTDFKKLASGKIGEVKIRKFTTKELFIFWTSKLAHYFFILGLPIYLFGFGKAIVGYLMFTATAGVVISTVFQLAHTVEEATFPVPDFEGKVEDEWAVHQIRTTAKFSTRSKIVTWLVGGLNFQVEHHLFPRISHVHYPEINKIVMQTCSEFGVPYSEATSFIAAVRSHIRHLKKIARE